ncbi:MAG: acetyl-CoA carboxylase, biotin carboxyl carrier protein [Bacillales bacterium]|jgi:acetyl-CoA carboxylase biotin carboxyl carrier protein|nr:acetyl-CoA carboxylase, biotin carboxyl carrier protein [Bacillales bacterium]
MKFEEIKELVKLINESNINEMKFEKDGTVLSLKKAAEVQHQALPVSQQPVIERQVAPVVAAQAPIIEAEPKQSIEENTYVIKAPMVGTFYRSPSPEQPSYVDLGSKIQPNTTVCLLEAMKLFNEIEAEVSGEIIEIHVQAGQLVEFGQPLFTVKL